MLLLELSSKYIPFSLLSSVVLLEWETPDRFKIEITKRNYGEWVKKFQTPTEWKLRVKILRECLIELTQITDFELREERIFS